MFSFLNTIIDLNKKTFDSMFDVMPEGQLKTASINLHKANTELAYKTVELADGYVDTLKKSFVK